MGTLLLPIGGVALVSLPFGECNVHVISQLAGNSARFADALDGCDGVSGDEFAGGRSRLTRCSPSSTAWPEWSLLLLAAAALATSLAASWFNSARAKKPVLGTRSDDHPRHDPDDHQGHDADDRCQSTEHPSLVRPHGKRSAGGRAAASSSPEPSHRSGAQPSASGPRSECRPGSDLSSGRSS